MLRSLNIQPIASSADSTVAGATTQATQGVRTAQASEEEEWVPPSETSQAIEIPRMSQRTAVRAGITEDTRRARLANIARE
jgi:hypothetical protein